MKISICFFFVILVAFGCKSDSNNIVIPDQVPPEVVKTEEPSISIPKPDTANEISILKVPSKNIISPECEKLKKELVSILERLISDSGKEKDWEAYSNIYDSQLHKTCLKEFQIYRDEIEKLEARIE